jgi:hypothetical protein
VRSLARQLLASHSELSAMAVPESKLGKFVLSLQTLRLAAAKIRAHGQKVDPEYEALADASCPLLRGPPPDARPLLTVIPGPAVPVPGEMVYLLLTELPHGVGRGASRWSLQLPPATLAAWRRRAPWRAWWVLHVRRLNLRCVLGLQLMTRHGRLRFPFVAAREPVTDPAVEFDGVLSLGFDARALLEVTSAIDLSYAVLNGKVSAGPVVEKLELWE